MRDKSHLDHIEKWARYVRDHPRSDWIKEVKPLVDSQIIMANRFYERLSKEAGGKEKIRLLKSRREDLRYMDNVASKSALTLKEADALADKVSASAAKKFKKERKSK